MIDARDFLDSVAGYANSGTGGPQSSTDRPIKLGTIDQYYTAGLARILFDGESSTSQKGYSWVSSYSPIAGDRVFLIPVGQSYIIGGKMSSSVDYSRYHALTMISGWGNFSDPSFHTPSFTKTVSGVVKLTGLTTGGNPGINYQIFDDLPMDFRPETYPAFPAMTAGNITGSIRMDTLGDGVIDGYANNSWLSFGNIILPPRGLVWATPTTVNGFSSGYDVLQYAKDSLGRIWLRGRLGRATAPAADTVMFNLPAGFRPQYQTHLPASSYSATVRSTALIDVMPNGDVRFKQDTYNPTNISLDGVMFCEASVGGWTNVTYQNGWVDNNTASQGPTRYRKDSDGLVHISGLARSGTIGATMFNLPAGFRPGKTIIRATQSANVQARLDIWGNGDVKANTGSASWYSIDGVSFTAEG
jgi:hypothetical protein